MYVCVSQISELPYLTTMSNLLRFNLSDNLLKAMPMCVHALTGQASFPHLKYFDLRGNQICTIPNLNTRLRDLEILNISRNKIQELPDEFLISMPSLRLLDASMNELCESLVLVAKGRE